MLKKEWLKIRVIEKRQLLIEGAEKIIEKIKKLETKNNKVVTNFIQLVSPQPVDRLSQTKLRWKAPNEGYLHICGIYKSDNK